MEIKLRMKTNRKRKIQELNNMEELEKLENQEIKVKK
uniref:Uncharacterized protein n=1 Tax=Meloidogyne hapla TaxID=6305 RepID=A0A1I8BVU3_MELHA